jgi:hypothetical protein
VVFSCSDFSEDVFLDHLHHLIVLHIKAATVGSESSSKLAVPKTEINAIRLDLHQSREALTREIRHTLSRRLFRQAKRRSLSVESDENSTVNGNGLRFVRLYLLSLSACSRLLARSRKRPRMDSSRDSVHSADHSTEAMVNGRFSPTPSIASAATTVEEQRSAITAAMLRALTRDIKAKYAL